MKIAQKTSVALFLLSLGLAFNDAKAVDSTTITPPDTLIGSSKILATGESPVVYANPWQPGAHTTWDTTGPDPKKNLRCPPTTHPMANYAARASANSIRYVMALHINCEQPDPVTYKVYCIDARWESPGNWSTEDGWIVITWIIRCVPDGQPM